MIWGTEPTGPGQMDDLGCRLCGHRMEWVTWGTYPWVQNVWTTWGADSVGTGWSGRLGAQTPRAQGRGLCRGPGEEDVGPGAAPQTTGQRDQWAFVRRQDTRRRRAGRSEMRVALAPGRLGVREPWAPPWRTDEGWRPAPGSGSPRGLHPISDQCAQETQPHRCRRRCPFT